ncbi:hypothetical protein BGW42_002809 [Actinomortierella wolfii]|nr:hypothetical protein BGW42_002809 [Actinomortierella wolfii]
MGPPGILPASCKTIRLEIMRHMAPLHRPREITPQNWDQFSVWAGEIDCGNVRHICLQESTNWDIIHRWWPDFSLQKLFRQCRRLSRINAYVKDANYFQWAIAEKTACKSKQRSGSEENENDTFGDGVNGNSSNVSRYVDGHTLHPFPLREVELQISNSVWDAVVADLFHVFDDTLEHAILYATNEGPETSQHIGLLECSRLRPEVREQVRKLWTWDWRLPYLTELNLIGEFAEWFKIKALASLPKLQTLKLELLQQKRRPLDLPKAWRWTPSSPISDGSDTSRKNEDATSSEGGYKDHRYVASALTEVTFKGRWHLLDETLETLLLDVLPNLQILDITECYGFTTACFVESLRHHPSIVSSTSSRQLTKADMKMMGLTTTKPSSTLMSQQGRPSPILNFNGEEFFFLK